MFDFTLIILTYRCIILSPEIVLTNLTSRWLRCSQASFPVSKLGNAVSFVRVLRATRLLRVFRLVKRIKCVRVAVDVE